MSQEDREKRMREMQGRFQRAFASGYEDSWLYRRSRLWRRLINWAMDYR